MENSNKNINMLNLFYCAGDVFAVIAPIDNDENVKYYLMCCTEQNMKLLENYDDNGFIYDRGSIILKGYFFQKNHQSHNFLFYFIFKTMNLMSYVINIVIWCVQYT